MGAAQYGTLVALPLSRWQACGGSVPVTPRWPGRVDPEYLLEGTDWWRQDIAGHCLAGTGADGLLQAPDRHGVVGGAFGCDLSANLEATGQQGAPLPADVGAGFWWPR